MDEHLCYGWTFKLWKFINFEIVEERERTEHIGQIKQDDLIKFPTHQKRKNPQGTTTKTFFPWNIAMGSL